MKYLLASILTLLTCLIAQQSEAQEVSVLASVAETTVGAEERVTYTLEVKGASFSDVETPQPPATEGLTLLQPIPSTQRNMTFINGQLEQSIAFRWTFRPVREGTARIAAIEVKVKGRTHATAPIDVRVVPQAQRPQQRSPGNWPFSRPAPQAAPDADGGDSPRIADTDLFIRVVPSQRAAFQNEQITLEYQLFFRDGIQLRHSRLAGSWDAEGFWREEFDVETRPIPRSTVVNGVRYNTITLKRVAVFPTRAGDLRIDPLRIETEAYVPYRSNDPFDQFFSLRNRFETVELASPDVSIQVRPLPGEAPPAFQGAVGDFELNTRVDRTDVEVGEPVEVTVSLRGTGNIATLDAPRFRPPGVFEQYDPQVNANIGRSGARVQGTKTFSYVLVPRSNGTFEIPPVAFSFFDPGRAEYETVQSDPITVRVTGSATTPLAASTTAEGLPVDDIAGPLVAAAWEATASTPLHEQPWTYGVLALPWLAVAGVYALRRRATRLATDTEYARNRMAHPVARKHLKKAEALLQRNDPRAFYEEIERAVRSFIGNRLNTAEVGLTREQLDARLADIGVAAATRSALRRLLDECDQARFAPVLPDRAMMESARDRAARLIVEIDEAAAHQPA